MAAVGVSVWQAIKARHMTSEFSESKYIGLTVFSMAQGFVTGIPVAAVVKDIPKGACGGCPNSSVAMSCVTLIVHPVLTVLWPAPCLLRSLLLGLNISPIYLVHGYPDADILAQNCNATKVCGSKQGRAKETHEFGNNGGTERILAGLSGW